MPGSPIFKNPEKYDIEIIDKDWNKHAHLLFRFSESEHVGLPFKFKKKTSWGNSFSRNEIISNIQQIQKQHVSATRVATYVFETACWR